MSLVLASVRVPASAVTVNCMWLTHGLTLSAWLLPAAIPEVPQIVGSYVVKPDGCVVVRQRVTSSVSSHGQHIDTVDIYTQNMDTVDRLPQLMMPCLHCVAHCSIAAHFVKCAVHLQLLNGQYGDVPVGILSCCTAGRALLHCMQVKAGDPVRCTHVPPCLPVQLLCHRSLLSILSCCVVCLNRPTGTSSAPARRLLPTLTSTPPCRLLQSHAPSGKARRALALASRVFEHLLPQQ